eukprot:6382049-Prymnesium_polylepis.1
MQACAACAVGGVRPLLRICLGRRLGCRCVVAPSTTDERALWSARCRTLTWLWCGLSCAFCSPPVPRKAYLQARPRGPRAARTYAPGPKPALEGTCRALRFKFETRFFLSPRDELDMSRVLVRSHQGLSTHEYYFYLSGVANGNASLANKRNCCKNGS